MNAQYNSYGTHTIKYEKKHVASSKYLHHGFHLIPFRHTPLHSIFTMLLYVCVCKSVLIEVGPWILFSIHIRLAWFSQFYCFVSHKSLGFIDAFVGKLTFFMCTIRWICSSLFSLCSLEAFFFRFLWCREFIFLGMIWTCFLFQCVVLQAI